MNKIAIVGASGFVGSTLAEELIAAGVPVRCFIHSTGNAWRLARHDMELDVIDLLDRDSVRQAITDCTHVVNCSRGSSDVMLNGLKNLLQACREVGSRQFVHISSVAVYGNEFSVSSIAEDYPTKPSTGSYGWKKLKQDEMVQRAARNGLKAVVVCPPNISGPYSMFWQEICNALISGTFAYVDQGQLPCPLVDVGNLVQAIRLALDTDLADGRRMFVCDQTTATWHDVITALARVVGVSDEIQSVSTSDASQMVQSQDSPRGSMKNSIKHLLSSDMRKSLRRDPYIGSAEKFAVGWAKRLPTAMQSRFRDNDHEITPAVTSKQAVSVRLLGQQLRNVSYSSSAANELLGYQPGIDFTSSIDRFEQWAVLHWGLGSSSYQLLSELR